MKLNLAVVLILGAIVTTGLAPARLTAQTRADSAAVLVDAARRLEADGRWDAARAVLELVQRRYAGTPGAAAAGARLSARAVAAELEQSGRVELTVWSTLYGLWLGGAVPLMMGSESPEAYGVGLLVGAPTGFLAARSYTRSHPEVTVGQARAITFAGTWGTWQGAGWMQVLGADENFDCIEFDICSYEEGVTTEQTVGAMVAGGLAGIATGVVLARKPIKAGVATTTSLAGPWGTWFGFALGIIAGQEEDALLTSTLLAGNATVAGAAVLAPRWNPSVNRARLVSLAGVMGGVVGGGVDLIIQPDNEDVAVAIPLVLSIAGLYVGSRMTRDYDSARRDGATGGDPGDFDRGALLNWNDGLTLGSLQPTPVLRRDPRSVKPRLQPAAQFRIFEARF